MFTHPIILLLIPYLVCAGLTAALIKVLAPAARRVDLVDYPNSRKVHETTVPLIGGIAIFISLTLSLLLFAEVSFASLRILFFCFAIIVVTGVLDDHRDIPPHAKFLVQILVAFLLVVLDGQTVLHIGDIFDRGVAQGLAFLAIPFSIIAIVAAINAQNLIDGYDGVCSVVTIVSLLGLEWKALETKHSGFRSASPQSHFLGMPRRLKIHSTKLLQPSTADPKRRAGVRLGVVGQ